MAANDYQLEYEFFITAPPASLDTLASGGGWGPAGRDVFTERIRLSSDQKSIDYEVFDNPGAPASGGGHATGHATRLEF